jgi:hypothetical protein
MNRREDLEARYDAMAPEVAERAYGDPLARRLMEAEGQGALMARLIRETIAAIRSRPHSPRTAARRADIAALWHRRRRLQANARELRLLIRQRDFHHQLWAAE